MSAFIGLKINIHTKISVAFLYISNELFENKIKRRFLLQ